MTLNDARRAPELCFNSGPKSDPRPQQVMTRDGVRDLPLFDDRNVQQMLFSHQLNRISNGGGLVRNEVIFVHQLVGRNLTQVFSGFNRSQ